jgi:hypothetical protein
LSGKAVILIRKSLLRITSPPFGRGKNVDQMITVKKV